MNERDSFVFYREWYEILANCDEQTQLSMYRAIMDYVFLGTIPTDPALQLVFPLIKIRLDSDSAKWVDVKEKRRQAALKKWQIVEDMQMHANASTSMQMHAQGCKRMQTDANDAVYVNVYGYKDTNVSMDTIEKETSLKRGKEKEVATVVATRTKEDIETRKRRFYEELIPYVEVYGKEMVRDFYEKWTEETPGRLKFKKELEKTWNTSLRLKTWAKRDLNKRAYGNSKAERIAEVSDTMRRRLEADGID